MKFRIINNQSDINDSDEIYLLHDSYDDFGYRTTFYVYYKNEYIGKIKIGHKDMISLTKEKNLQVYTSDNYFDSYSIRLLLDPEFESMNEGFYSLGQSNDYYSNVVRIIPNIKEYFLGLNDLAYDYKYSKLYEMNDIDCCFRKSIMRDLHFSVLAQFNRISHYQAELSKYDFEYNFNDEKIDIHVDPYSNPPSNIHVIIGRNGVGKTFILMNMICSVLRNMNQKFTVISDKYSMEDCFTVNTELKDFAGIIGVSFSVFDDGLSSIRLEGFTSNEKDLQDKVYKYIGIVETKEISENDLDTKDDVFTKLHDEKKESLENFEKHENDDIIESIIDLPRIKRNEKKSKTYDELRLEFVNSIKKIKNDNERRNLYFEMCEYLNSDTMLKENHFYEIFNRYLYNQDKNNEERNDMLIGNFFCKLSSGHMIIVLALTRICEAIHEKTLVLIDEPEMHLHPPLLSSYIRALSFILRKKNAVAIVATHSPIVLQEVPKSCAKRICRKDRHIFFQNLNFETFGSGTDLITREIFEYDILKSGFYRLIQEQLENDFESTMSKFSDSIGSLGQMLILDLLARKESEDKK